MIAEWFYPKELKEIIADLRAKDDLNEVALRRLNWDFYWIFIPFFLLSLGMFLNEIRSHALGVELPVFCLLFFVLYPFYDMRRTWRVYYASYFYGKKSIGVVEYIEGAVAWTIRFGVIDEDTGGASSCNWDGATYDLFWCAFIQTQG